MRSVEYGMFHDPGEPGSLTSPPPEFDLVPLEVGLVLYHFYKTLVDKISKIDFTKACGTIRTAEIKLSTDFGDA